jgi:SAM-dependent methyltransferase
MDRYTQSNRRLWDEWTTINERSDFYALESFKKGEGLDRPHDAAPGVRVRGYEVEEVGEVKGKSLLHLQCHFGIDTLSWARLGARVTGIDFSVPAIERARGLADELGIEARFLVSSVQDLRDNLDGTFDIVYTSRGAITWLPDLSEWASTIVHFLCPGGIFYITEFHPILWALDDASEELRVAYPYFPSGEPVVFPVEGSYADPDAEVQTEVEYAWPHPIGEVVTAIAGAGLVVELLNEFDWVDYKAMKFLEQSEDGRWRLPKDVKGELPLMYSLRARKPAASSR